MAPPPKSSAPTFPSQPKSITSSNVSKKDSDASTSSSTTLEPIAPPHSSALYPPTGSLVSTAPQPQFFYSPGLLYLSFQKKVAVSLILAMPPPIASPLDASPLAITSEKLVSLF
jgi:hypothetical protein